MHQSLSALLEPRALRQGPVLNKRLTLLNGLDADFRRKFNDKGVNAYNGFYDDALALMKSKELKAFDLSGESEEQRAAYGDNPFGQGCLLARRLVDSGVRFVEVKHDGWDHHKALADEMSEVAPVFDQAFRRVRQVRQVGDDGKSGNTGCMQG